MNAEADYIASEIRVVTRYVARDDSEHLSIRCALRRARELDALDAANAALEAGATVYDAARLLGEGATPPESFRLITKDTPLVIEHWQCRREPGYRVIRFTIKGIEVWGNAGSWSGPYGNTVRSADLDRYIQQTFKAEMQR